MNNKLKSPLNILVFQIILFFCGLGSPLISQPSQSGSAIPALKPSDFSSQDHPRVFATSADKRALLKKIGDYEWAGRIYNNLKKDLDSLVERHVVPQGRS